MKIVFRITFMLFVISSVIFSQENQSPFPKFTPYVNIQDSSTQSSKTDMRKLGMEQPARWLSVDPMADKYPGWSPYNYTMNNPLRFLDPNGDSVVVLLASKGAQGWGHMASLIGNEKDGWRYYSKDGAVGPIPGFGPAEYTEDQKYSNLAEFSSKQTDYNFDNGFMIESNSDTDNKMQIEASNTVKSFQAAVGNNCADAVSNTLESGGFNGGKYANSNTNPLMGNRIPNYNPIPNDRYKAIINKNNGIDVSNLIRPRK